MATFWQKTLFYLGLVDDEGGLPGRGSNDLAASTVTTTDQAGPLTTRPPGSIAGRRVDPPDSYKRRTSNWEHTEAGVWVQPDAGSDYEPLTSASPDTEVITARNFSDAQMLADGIGNGRAVVLDLRSTEPEMVRRLVDFTSGLTYALNGKMAKIAQGVILVSPAGVTVGVDELERLAEAGLYSAG